MIYERKITSFFLPEDRTKAITKIRRGKGWETRIAIFMRNFKIFYEMNATGVFLYTISLSSQKTKTLKSQHIN